MNRTLSLHVDIETGGLIDPATWLPINTIPAIKRGDTVAFELDFHRKNAESESGYEAVTLAETGSYFVGMKVYREFAAGLYLAQTETITVAGAKLEFTLALTSTGLTERLSGNKDSVATVMEIPYTHVEEGTRTIASFRLDVLNDYVKGTEGDPAPEVPTYYTAAQVAALFVPADGDGQKIVTASDGKQRMAYLFPDDVWRVLLPVIVDDQPTFTWEDVTE